jgi:hypothetical protein
VIPIPAAVRRSAEEAESRTLPFDRIQSRSAASSRQASRAF